MICVEAEIYHAISGLLVVSPIFLNIYDTLET